MFVVVYQLLIAKVSHAKVGSLKDLILETFKLKGLARTQIPTNKNDDVEFPTFGEIAGVNHSVVQWSSLALEEPPS